MMFPLFAALTHGCPVSCGGLPVAVLGSPLLGLAVVATALLTVWAGMILMRKAFTHYRVPEPVPGSLLMPADHDRIPPEVVAVIAAAVSEEGDPNAIIVAISPLEKGSSHGPIHAWSNEGRREHFASHKVR